MTKRAEQFTSAARPPIVSAEKIQKSRTAVSEQQRELPAHLFFTPELPSRDADLLSLLRSEREYEQVRAEYERGSYIDLRSSEAREKFFRRIRAPQHLSAFEKEIQQNPQLLKVCQLAAIAQCISASLTACARGRGSRESSASPLFPKLRNAYRGQSMGRLSGHVGDAITGQLIERSGWEARYPNPVLDALVGFDRIAYEPRTHSWRVIQCKAVNRLNVPFVVAGEEKFGRLDRVLDAAGAEISESRAGRRATSEETLKHWKESLAQLASTCTILEKQYPGNTVMPLLVVTAGINSKAYAESTDMRTGLLRDDFRGSIDFEKEKEVL